MSREIKFRAWDGKQMLILNLFQGEHYKDDFILRNSDQSVGWIDDDISDVLWPIMQFTGLKDSNGKEIYEGDIVKDKYDSIGIINYGTFALDSDFHYWTMGWYYEWEYKEWDEEIRFSRSGLFNEGDEDDPKCTLEVIGNIYENPNLLNP